MKRLSALVLCAVMTAPVWAKTQAPMSDAVTVPRPPEGEYFGLYLMGKKVGWLYTVVKLNAAGDQLISTSDYRFKVQLGTRASERAMTETKVYDAKPGGKLLSFTLRQAGDGGDQLVEGKTTPKGFVVTRSRPGQPNDVLPASAPTEAVEDADQARVALKRNGPLVGVAFDTTELKQWKLSTTLAGEETRLIRGVKVRLRKTVTISDKEKVPTEAYTDDRGRTVEVRFGSTMTASAESEEVAKRLDVIEVFGLTRVVLPKPAPPTARTVPGALTMVMSGLPSTFHVGTYRQTYKPLDGGKVEVTLRADLPKKRAPLPVIDPNGGKNLESTPIVEAKNADIIAVAKKVVADEKDAWAAAKKVNRWVFEHVKSDYGVSSDRSTDVLKTMRGDCTEHALLAVAMLRAVGIPAKRVDGVVYLMNDDNVPALYWHEWVEAYVGEWTQLDPTFGQDVADPTHFGVGEESNAEITPLIGTLKVHDVR